MILNVIFIGIGLTILAVAGIALPLANQCRKERERFARGDHRKDWKQ